jgi:hypothetical protein
VQWAGELSLLGERTYVAEGRPKSAWRGEGASFPFGFAKANTSSRPGRAIDVAR